MKNAQRDFECPSCHRELEIPDEVITDLCAKDARGRMVAYALAGVFALLLVIAVIVVILKAQAIANNRHAVAALKAERDEAKAKVESLSRNSVRMEKEAETALREAKVESEKARKQAEATLAKAEDDAKQIRGRAEEFAAMIEGKMHQVYGDLKLYKDGVNVVNGTYVESFQVSRDRIIISMLNRTNSSVKPRVVIQFYDSHGFVLAGAEEKWVFDTIDAGGRRVQDSSISFAHGGVPYYYSLSE